MSWKIRYCDQETELWLNNLTHQQFKSLAKELKILERCGNTLRLPHSKALGDGLFELRERTFGYRIYYGFSSNKTIVLLTAGNKSTQTKDLKTAQLRLKLLKQTEVFV